MFYFAYLGNKRNEIKEIEEDIFKMIEEGTIKKIVEPFCGSCALSSYLYYKYGDKLEYHLNDNDCFLMEFLTDIKNGKGDKYFDFINDECENLTEQRFKEIVNNKNPINALHYIFMKKVFNFRMGLFPKGKKYGNYKFEKYHKLSKFFQDKNTFLYFGDYSHIFKKFQNDETALIFLDPPYLDSFNGYYNTFREHVDNENNIIDNTQMFADIGDLFENKAKVVAILNSVGIIKYCYRDYYKKEYEKRYSLTKNLKKGMVKTQAKHAIFSNY